MNAALSMLAPLRRMREMKRSTSKRSRTSVLTRTRAHQQTAVPGSLKWMVIAAPGVAFLLWSKDWAWHNPPTPRLS